MNVNEKISDSLLISTAILILVNIILLYGVTYRGWNVTTVLFAYWLESAVVGFYTVLRMIQAGGVPSTGSRIVGLIFLIPFFFLHFGLFMAVHYFLITSSFGGPRILSWEIAVIITLLLISHGASHYLNYLRGGEFLTTDPKTQMGRPYPRIIIMQFVIIFGGFLIFSERVAFQAIMIVVIGKIAVDAITHFIMHYRAMKRVAVSSEVELATDN
ncbi:MAG: hypothetical protein GTO18_12985 [Anaerolineales bacterium]|nr:hypothetical protein [Anaerolineales bacterium]